MTYEPTLQSVRQHEVPKWFQDAKIGIFVHWGPFTIPAFAPIGRGTINEILVKEGTASFLKNATQLHRQPVLAHKIYQASARRHLL